jgi:hypothetical protein
MATSEYDGFYGAAQARQVAMGQASGTNVVLTEINALQIAVNTAASGGALEYITVGTTTMTNATTSTDYFNAWNDPYTYDNAVHKLARENMNFVINYFTRLGYSITRNRNGTDSYFNWKIIW